MSGQFRPTVDGAVVVTVVATFDVTIDGKLEVIIDVVIVVVGYSTESCQWSFLFFYLIFF